MKKIILGLSLIALIYACNNTESSDGQEIYNNVCVACHGADGTLGVNGAKDLTASELSLEERIAIVTDGKAGTTMISYKSILSEDEIEAVSKYTMTLKK